MSTSPVFVTASARLLRLSLSVCDPDSRHQPLLDQPTSPERPREPVKPAGGASGGYSILRDDDSPDSPVIQQQRKQQRRLAGDQQRHLDRIGESVGTLRDMSQRLGTEVDDQSM